MSKDGLEHVSIPCLWVKGHKDGNHFVPDYYDAMICHKYHCYQ